MLCRGDACFRVQVLPDGRNVTGCFTSDFTLAEVQQLRARQALAFRDHQHDGKYRWANQRPGAASLANAGTPQVKGFVTFAQEASS